MLVPWKVAYFHAGRSRESLFSAVASCGRKERGSLKDTEILLMWSGQCWRDLTAHTAIASQSRIPQEIPVLWNICQASSTPRVISSLRGWKGQMCLWCNCSEASRDLSGTQSPGWSVTALPHSAAGGNPAQSSECLLLNRPNRHFWTEICVCLGTEGVASGIPPLSFQALSLIPTAGALPLARWAQLSSSRGCWRGGPPEWVCFCLNGGC